LSTKKRATNLKVMHVVSKTATASPPSTQSFRILQVEGSDRQGSTSRGNSSQDNQERRVKNDMTDEQRAILQALQDLGGKDQASMDIAKKLGFDKKFPDAPRAPVRNAMERLHELHYVTSKKTGIKYSYSITDKGIEALKPSMLLPSKTRKRDQSSSLLPIPIPALTKES